MSNLLAKTAGRRARWVVLLAWVAILMVAVPLGAGFEGAQKNESASFLPDGTESLDALKLSDRFASGEQVPAIIVFARDGELTAADNAAIEGVVQSLREDPPKFADAPAPAQRSEDGRAAIVVLPLEPGADSEALIEVVQELRKDIVADLPDGLEAKVGGPAGFSADAIEVFGNINGTLLIATASLVFILLLLIYRSPIFWIIPLFSVLAAEVTVRMLGYLLIQAGITVNGQTGGILLVLVFGAGTDYALLLVSRYREELHQQEDKIAAMATALRAAGPAIIASAGTVVAGLLVLSLAQVNGTQGLGQVGALGVAVAAITMVTLLPALLLVTGRWVFWPFVPRVDHEDVDAHLRRGFFAGMGRRVARRPRAVWVTSIVVLLVMCAGLFWFNLGLTSANGFRGDVEAVAAQELISESFAGGSAAPTEVVVTKPAKTEEVRTALEQVDGVVSVAPAEEGDGATRIIVTLEPEPYSPEAYALIPDLRAAITDAVGEDVALVGGPTAQERDLRAASARDSKLLPPIVLLVVLVILFALLRSIVAPLVLVGTVILSYAAAMGVSVFVFEKVFGFPGVDPSFPLFAFIFLVALGVDYNIFLMARVREETEAHGTRDGMLRGLAATGSVITSAGIVLAGTFAVLGVLPLVALSQIGFVVAFGVLLDTLFVRSVLVPAITIDLGARTWWPSQLWRTEAATSDNMIKED